MAASSTILCVDDEPSVLFMQKALLESAGFRVLTATCGSDALAILQSQRLDVVVMDYWMTGMNGVTTARQMKELKPEVPIVFLSAYSEILDETLGLAEWWAKKGEQEPHAFLRRLAALVSGKRSTSDAA